MSVLNWFRELGVAGKLGVLVATGTAVCATSYGLYVLLAKQRDRDENGGQAADEALEKRVLVLGLDGAGKSTFLGALAQQTLTPRVETKPTEGFNVLCVTTDGLKLNVWEIGGAEKFRSYWPNFFGGTSVVVYVVDASDHQRFDECNEALARLLADKRLRGVPVILIANKQDQPGAKTSAEIVALFEIPAKLEQGRKFGAVGVQVLESGESDGLQEAKQLILNLCAD